MKVKRSSTGRRTLRPWHIPGICSRNGAWRDRNAHAAEQEVVRASLRALEGAGAMPSQKDRDEAHKLRQTANDLFTLAMDEMKKRARAAKR